MAGGYIGKNLFVNLSTGDIKEEKLDEKLCRDFLGGYGIGARIIYDRQKAGIDPLGADNHIGFTTGPLTGAPVPFGSRYCVVGKSPLTNTWGDANSGGFFGPMLKFAGYDHVFVTGIAEKPVYLFINQGKAELRDASHIWCKDSNETDEVLKNELGAKAEIACIGPSGEKASLISCIINNKGRAAARSGLGAVMGSKRLKAVVALGTMSVPLADADRVEQVRKEINSSLGGIYDILREYGTCGGYAEAVVNGDAPVKNWGGVGPVDLAGASATSDTEVISLQDKRYACFRCPVGCGGMMKAGQKYNYPQGAHKPEYETLAAFGSMLVNDDLESIIMANHLCNTYGLDTISAGAAIAFAIECYENGIITKSDTDGIELTWGDHHAAIKMLENMCNRYGFGDILADGVKVASEKIGKGSEQFAIHVGGQELPMHDPRLSPSFGATYMTDPTPGRHTQGGLGGAEMGMDLPMLPPVERYAFTGKADLHAMLVNSFHTINCTGLCQLGVGTMPAEGPANLVAAVTGWEFTLLDVLPIGERIAHLRQAFNVREGIKPSDFQLPMRTKGQPPLQQGPLANVTVDVDNLAHEFLQVMEWDSKTGKPSKDKLIAVGLEDVARDLWP